MTTATRLSIPDRLHPLCEKWAKLLANHIKWVLNEEAPPKERAYQYGCVLAIKEFLPCLLGVYIPLGQGAAIDQVDDVLRDLDHSIGYTRQDIAYYEKHGKVLLEVETTDTNHLKGKLDTYELLQRAILEAIPEVADIDDYGDENVE